MKLVERGDNVTVLKGTHRNKTGIVMKVLRVFVNIQFDDGTKGRTLPSSIKIMEKPKDAVSDDELENPSADIMVNGKTDDAVLENYRVMSVAMLTEMLAQGMALLGQQSEKQLAREMLNLQERIQEIRRNL